ncbi:FAD-binding oxidoreductase [Sphingomonas aracearum]|uniref:FAD-binding FR-type domain-containing protein n=1 Tax=Sphingomonas aracearum TaxID=2283317 RepID=A0A369VSX4_9SPHN|nr:FAD-binding oxidoreductase [Sphingomonas aracearum]RDE04959.1 hypothetical protein DVW87_15470 [Sphingomonas aracearum]
MSGASLTAAAPASDQPRGSAGVTALRDLSPTIREITLRADRAFACPPGSHIRVAVNGAGREDYRSYSVVEQAGDLLRIAVKRQPLSRGGSAFMWRLQPGDTVRMTPPRCDFPLTLGAPHYLLLAGGVGITPPNNAPSAARR